MQISKITTGFVIQVYDTESGKFISQEFVAGDDVVYESGGESVDGDLIPNYLPFDMVQPTPGELLQQAKYAALDLRWAMSELDRSGDYKQPAWGTLVDLDAVIRSHDPTWQTVVDWVE